MRRFAVLVGVILVCILLIAYPLAAALVVGLFIHAAFSLPTLGSCIIGFVTIYGLIWITILLLMTDVQEIE